MSDLQLRRLERKAYDGDIHAGARQLLMRVRSGMVPYQHVVWASYLRDPIARLIEEKPCIQVDCGYCKARRERFEADTRQYKEPLLVCLKCRNTGRTNFDGDLIKFVKRVEEVPLRCLIAWVCDCAEHALERIVPKNPRAWQGRYRLPGVPERDPMLQNVILNARRWLETGHIDTLLFQVAQGHSMGSEIAQAVAQSEMDGVGLKLRRQLAIVVSHAWNGTRVERTWQERRLIHYLLSY